MRALSLGRAGDATPMTQATTPAVACRALTKSFGLVVAVRDVTCHAQDGEILALLGPSGCGKTTFLRLVAGFEVPDAGEIELAGRIVAGSGRGVPPERRRVGFVFQDYALFPHLTVAGNVGYGVRDHRARAERVAQTLALVGLEGLGDRYPHELSGGQQQRVALARALAPGPSIVLLDEPFSNLDADLRARVRTEVRGILRAAGATAIFVTHDQDEALEIADRVAVMREGRIEQLGRPEEIYHTPATRFVADFVGEAWFLPATVDREIVTCELGTYSLGGAAVEPGEAEIMLRPEDISLEPDPDGADRVVERRFQGPVVLSVVRLGSGRTVMSAHSSQMLTRPGDLVRAAFRPDHIVLFRGEHRITWVPPRARSDQA